MCIVNIFFLFRCCSLSTVHSVNPTFSYHNDPFKLSLLRLLGKYNSCVSKLILHSYPVDPPLYQLLTATSQKNVTKLFLKMTTVNLFTCGLFNDAVSSSDSNRSDALV
jgi:hypothetical protein